MASRNNRRTLKQAYKDNSSPELASFVFGDSSDVLPSASPSLNGNLEDKVRMLEEEIETLRAHQSSSEEQEALEQKIAELTAQLEERGGVHEIEVEKIQLDPNQPRTIYPQSVINIRAESLRKEGQLTPVILIPLENGEYRLFDGHLRRIAAPIAGLTHLKAVLRIEEDPAITFDQQLSTSIQSEKLHGLDLAYGLIKLMQYYDAALSEQQIPTILNTTIQKLKRFGKDSELERLQSTSLEEQQSWIESLDLDRQQRFVLEVILGKSLNPASINVNIFPLLKLPMDIQSAMREGLEASKARELGKLTATRLKLNEMEAIALRKSLAQEAIAQQWSLSILRQKIKDATQPKEEAKPRPAQRIVEKVQGLFDGIAIDPYQDRAELEELEKQLQEQLAKVRSLLQA